MDYMLKRWSAFARFLDDGRICLTNNCAERELWGVPLGRKSWRFAASDRGGERAAAMYKLIATAKRNGVDPQVWLAHVLARINDHKITDLAASLPWQRAADQQARKRAQPDPRSRAISTHGSRWTLTQSAGKAANFLVGCNFETALRVGPEGSCWITEPS